MKKYLLLALLCIVVFTFTGCETEKTLTNIAEYEGCKLEVADYSVETTDTGKTLLKVFAHYTNTNSTPYYAYCSFSVKAFQHNTELVEVSNINGDEASLIREVKDGASLSVCYVFELDDESPVEVLVCTPTASEEIIAKAVFLEAETSEGSAS